MKIKRKNFQKVIITILVITIILTITIKIIGRKTISTIETNKISKVENNEEKANDESVNWVESADGKLVPVPKGYSASQIEGENTVDGGFVIYEGEIDWNSILDGSAAKTLTEQAKEMDELNAIQEKVKQNEENNTSTENSTQEIEKNENQNAQETSIQTANINEDGISAQAETKNAYSITREDVATYYNTLEEAIAGANEGDTIKIEKDVEDASEEITIDKNLNIDTGTYTVKTNKTIKINSGVTLNLQGTGIITNSSNVNTITNLGTLEINTEVAIENIATTNTISAINNWGTINISAGTIEATYRGINQDRTGGTSNITGGKIKATNGTSGYGIYNYGSSSSGRTEVRVAGGVVEGGKYGIYHYSNRYTYTYIGDNASEFSKETPTIIGGTNGIYTYSSTVYVYIYNGIIKGKEEAYHGNKPIGIRTGYKVVQGIEKIEGEEYKTLYLEKVDEEVTEEEISIFNLQKTVNQYVWVPVEDVTEIYGTDSKGKMLGKLYRSYGETAETRTKLNWIETKGIMSWSNKIDSEYSYREPDVITARDGKDTDKELTNYVEGQTRSELLAEEIERDFAQMIKSIKKYGGFYIGRYETGGLSNSNVKSAVVRKMQTAISNTRWYTMYEAAKNLKGTNKNVETGIIWGSLWDAMLDWLVESGAETTEGEKVTNEMLTTEAGGQKMGNFSYSTFNYIGSEENKPIATTFKWYGSQTKIPTGSAEYTKVNNIYDMAGNVNDLTLETKGDYGRAKRGSDYSSKYAGAAYRSSSTPIESHNINGMRVLLLIN